MIEVSQRMIGEQKISLLIDILNWGSRRFFKIHKRSRKVGTAFEIEKRKGAEDNKHRRYTTLDYREIKMLCIVLYLVNREEKKKNSPYTPIGIKDYQSLSNVAAENNLKSLKS